MTSRRSRGLPARMPLRPDGDPAVPPGDETADEPRRPLPRRPRPAPPPRWLDATAQRRLLTLVAMLALVLLLMDRARQPRHWRWLWSFGNSAPAEANDTALEGIPDRTSADDPITSDDAPGADAGWPVGLDRELLRDVEDNRHFRAAEQTAWFHLWHLLMETPSEELRRQSVGPVTYLQIFTQTAAYRGRLVDLSGTIRRVYRVDAPANEQGLELYAQCWFFPDSNGNQPIVLYVLDFPTDVPDASDLELRCDLTGIVYKRWNYVSAGGIEVAPVVLAKDVILHAPAVSAPKAGTQRPVPIALIAATAAASVLTAALLFRLSGRRRGSVRHAEELPKRLPDSVGPLNTNAGEQAAEPR